MCTCHKCNKKYKVDILVSSEVWEMIYPNKDGGGLLCGICILELIENLGGYSAFNLKEVKC